MASNQRKIQLREAYSNNLWDGARKTLATLWDGHGAIWHGRTPQGSFINAFFPTFKTNSAFHLETPCSPPTPPHPPSTCGTGYEIHGLEKIPDAGPALIVYYHGAIPIDYYYFLASVIIQKGRTCHSVADHFIFKIPGLYTLHSVDAPSVTLVACKVLLKSPL